MKLEGTDFWLGKMGSTFFIWNNKYHYNLSAKNVQQAKKEALQLIKEQHGHHLQQENQR